MYLLAFVTLIIGVLSVYTQVLAVQTSRLAAASTTAADVMLTWHNLATTVVDGDPTYFNNPANVGATGCSLTPQISNPPPCNGGSDVVPSNSVLPGGTTFKWYTVAYRPTTNNALHIITWAPPPTSGRTSDSITSPPIGINLSDLLHQLQNTNFSPLLYGTVRPTSPPLLTTTVGVVSTTVPLEYSVPSNAVPVGSVGVISLR